jgi:dienelactone hydrolase
MKLRPIQPVLFALAVASCAGGGSGEVATVTYRSGNPTLTGYLCKPEGPGPFAAAVYNHGGLGDIVGGAPRETCRALAASGFVGFSPIRRRTRPMHGHLDDVMAGLNYVRGLDMIDPDRLAMIGFSRGGLLTLGAASQGVNLQAVVIMASALGRGHLEAELANAGAVIAPVLILVAENDTGSRRTMGQNLVRASRRIDRALKAAGRESTLIVYPPYGDDGHTMFFEVGSYWADVEKFLNDRL